MSQRKTQEIAVFMIKKIAQGRQLK